MRLPLTILSILFLAIFALQPGDALYPYSLKTNWLEFSENFLTKIPKKIPSAAEIPDQWFTQKLDHSDVTNSQTWQQRYFVNKSLFKGTGPVFLFIGGEGEANPFFVQYGMMMEWAAQTGALAFELEHRYYGKSQPTKDLSTPNLKYLSSAQALEDMAYFIDTQIQNYKLTAKNKWIVFGGSYAGNLAAWFRLKYPHLAYGAVASSASVLAKFDFKEYYGVVARSLETSPQGKLCTAAIQQATTALRNSINSNNCCANIQSLFNLCFPLNKTNKFDVGILSAVLAGNFAGIVQNNNPSAPVNINSLCKMMTNVTLGSPLARYAAIHRMRFGSKCNDFRYATILNNSKRTSWSTQDASRQWFYQTCTEFGYYQTSDLKEQPFGINGSFPANLMVLQCADVFGPQFNAQKVQMSIKRTNMVNGGLALQLTRTIFSNGSIDPWRALGITTKANGNIAIYINGTSHCADLVPSSPNDSAELKAARLLIKNNLNSWLK